MRKKPLAVILVFVCLTCIFCLTFETLKNKSQTQIPMRFAYSIDNHFVPRINNATSEVEKREYQEAYYDAWKQEFENVIQWTDAKFLYESDKYVLSGYVSDVEKLIESTERICLLNFTSAYIYEPDSLDRYSQGNGTRCGILELQAGIYRNACLPLITEEYEFLSCDF